jgi:hypothetical protein
MMHFLVSTVLIDILVCDKEDEDERRWNLWGLISWGRANGEGEDEGFLLGEP